MTTQKILGNFSCVMVSVMIYCTVHADEGQNSLKQTCLSI